MSKRHLRGFTFERMEDRRLLAADFGMEVIDAGTLPAETCMASAVVVEEECSTDCCIESSSTVEPETEIETDCDLATPTQETGEAEPTSVEVESETEVIDEVEVEAAEVDTIAIPSNELRDPVTGTSGYFGVIDAESPSKSLTFAPSESGSIDLVVASSFGDSETRVEITDANGDLVAASMTEDLSGFQKLSFDVSENETYEIEVSSDDSGEGYFMVTVDFVEPEPVAELADAHVDEIGKQGTSLEFVDGVVSIDAALESGEDQDAFRFVAPADGEIVLAMDADSDNHSSDAIVSVFDSASELIVSGSTNEEVAIRFDTTSGAEYHVLVNSINDVPTIFSLTGNMFADVVEEADPIDVISGEIETVLDDGVNGSESDELFVCDDPVVLDNAFADLGESLDSEMDLHRHRFGGHRHGRWFSWI